MLVLKKKQSAQIVADTVPLKNVTEGIFGNEFHNYVDNKIFRHLKMVQDKYGDGFRYVCSIISENLSKN